MPAGIPVACMGSDKSLTLSWLNYSRHIRLQFHLFLSQQVRWRKEPKKRPQEREQEGPKVNLIKTRDWLCVLYMPMHVPQYSSCTPPAKPPLQCMRMHFHHLLAWGRHCCDARDITEYLSCRMGNKVNKASTLLCEKKCLSSENRSTVSALLNAKRIAVLGVHVKSHTV